MPRLDAPLAIGLRRFEVPTLATLPIGSARRSVNILLGELVAVGAMCLRPSQTTTNILLQGDGFEVSGIHALTVATQVVDLKTFGDWPFVKLIREAMGVGAAASLEGPVTTRTEARLPLPAAAPLTPKNVCPETIFGRKNRGRRGSVLSVRDEVPIAETPPLVFALAAINRTSLRPARGRRR